MCLPNNTIQSKHEHTQTHTHTQQHNLTRDDAHTQTQTKVSSCRPQERCSMMLGALRRCYPYSRFSCKCIRRNETTPASPGRFHILAASLLNYIVLHENRNCLTSVKFASRSTSNWTRIPSARFDQLSRASVAEAEHAYVWPCRSSWNRTNALACINTYYVLLGCEDDILHTWWICG